MNDVAQPDRQVLPGNRPLDTINAYLSSLSDVHAEIISQMDNARTEYGSSFNELCPEEQDNVLSQPFIEPSVWEIEYEPENWGATVFDIRGMAAAKAKHDEWKANIERLKERREKQKKKRKAHSAGEDDDDDHSRQVEIVSTLADALEGVPGRASATFDSSRRPSQFSQLGDDYDSRSSSAPLSSRGSATGDALVELEQLLDDEPSLVGGSSTGPGARRNSAKPVSLLIAQLERELSPAALDPSSWKDQPPEELKQYIDQSSRKNLDEAPSPSKRRMRRNTAGSPSAASRGSTSPAPHGLVELMKAAGGEHGTVAVPSLSFPSQAAPSSGRSSSEVASQLNGGSSAEDFLHESGSTSARSSARASQDELGGASPKRQSRRSVMGSTILRKSRAFLFSTRRRSRTLAGSRTSLDSRESGASNSVSPADVGSRPSVSASSATSLEPVPQSPQSILTPRSGRRQAAERDSTPRPEPRRSSDVSPSARADDGELTPKADDVSQRTTVFDFTPTVTKRGSQIEMDFPATSPTKTNSRPTSAFMPASTLPRESRPDVSSTAKDEEPTASSNKTLQSPNSEFGSLMMSWGIAMDLDDDNDKPAAADTRENDAHAGKAHTVTDQNQSSTLLAAPKTSAAALPSARSSAASTTQSRSQSMTHVLPRRKAPSTSTAGAAGPGGISQRRARPPVRRPTSQAAAVARPPRSSSSMGSDV